MDCSWCSACGASDLSDKMARNWRKVFKGLQFPKKLCPEELIKVQTLHVVMILLVFVPNLQKAILRYTLSHIRTCLCK
jgi:hypothetical protein